MELFAGPLAFDTWPQILEDREVIHFVDNSAALSALVKGYSPVGDSIKLTCDYWLRAAKHRLNLWVDRVESKSNISDDPSRFNVEKEMERIGARYTPPNLSFLDSEAPSRQPNEWFGGLQRVKSMLVQLKAELFQ